MTRNEALNLKSFASYCTCGGFAAGSSNDRSVHQPHMSWCPQAEEYAEYRRALDIPPNVTNADGLALAGRKRSATTL
jgi:hypothetical protein